MSDTLKKWSPYGLSVLRIIASLLFVQHGIQKYFHYPPGGHTTGPFELFSLIGLAGSLELFGGSLLAVGIYARPIAFLLCGEMAIGYFMIHFPEGLRMQAGLFPVVNGGDLAVLFCVTFLHLFLEGPGPWSADALFRKRS